MSEIDDLQDQACKDCGLQHISVFNQIRKIIADYDAEIKRLRALIDDYIPERCKPSGEV